MKPLALVSIFSVFVFVLLAHSASAQTVACDPTIKLVNQDPNPAVPNSYVKVVFQVSNLGSCNGYTIKLDPQYPFSLDPGAEAVQTIVRPPYVQDYKTTWDVPYKVRIADDALEDEYELKLMYHEGSDQGSAFSNIEEGFNVSIVDSQTDFATVVQESSGTQVSLGIVNTGKNPANSLIVRIPQQDNFRTTGVSEQILGNLAAGDYTLVSFSLSPKFARNMTRGTSTSGSTQMNPADQLLKVQIDYTDSIGKRRSVTKELQYSEMASGNFTFSGTRGANGTRTSASTSTSIAWYWYVIAVVVLIILWRVYSHWKSNKKRSRVHDGKEDPEWVQSERAHRKK